MQEVAILEKFLNVDIISTEMTVFNAMWVFHTIQASFPDIIPVLKTFEKGDWHKRRELKHLRKKSKRRVRKRDSPFRKARALLTLGHGKVPGRALRARRKAGCCGLSLAAYNGRWTWDTRVPKLVILHSSDAWCLPHPDKYFWDWGQLRIHAGCQISKHL